MSTCDNVIRKEIVVNKIILTMFRTRIKDPTCWFHFVKRSVFGTVNPKKLKSTGFFLASELHFSAERRGLKIREVPMFFPSREEGKSKISVKVAANFGMDAFRYLFRSIWRK